MKEAEEIGASRRMNSLTLNRHTEILEILEIPQLMDTCVRNGYYEEALELAAYVKRLEKKHTALPVIQVRAARAAEATPPVAALMPPTFVACRGSWAKFASPLS